LAQQGEHTARERLANPPPLPPAAAHVWTAFTEIARTRQIGGMGLARLTRSDVRLWEADEGVRLERWERRLIFRMDEEWLAAMSPKAKPTVEPGSHYIP
jgi:hypothetical protein